MRSLKHLTSYELYRYFQWTDNKEAKVIGFLWWSAKYYLFIVTIHQFDKLICLVTSHDWKSHERTFVIGDVTHYTGRYWYECLRCGKEVEQQEFGNYGGS